MDTKKIITISIIFIVLLAAATATIAIVKPQMHKSFQFQQIIFKKVK